MSKILIDRAVLEQALKALASYCNTGEIDGADDLLASLLAERDLRPQVEQEPVAWMYDWITEEGALVTDWIGTDLAIVQGHNIRPLYTNPQPKREPLTNELIQELAEEGVFHANVFEIVRRIEEEHGIFKLRAHGIGGEE